MFLTLSIAILAVSVFDIAYTLAAHRRFHIDEANRLWRWGLHHPVALHMLSGLFHLGVRGALIYYRAVVGVFIAALVVRVFVCAWNWRVVQNAKERKERALVKRYSG
jgi:hypothetical protein